MSTTPPKYVTPAGSWIVGGRHAVDTTPPRPDTVVFTGASATGESEPGRLPAPGRGYRCIFCGGPSWRRPADQELPPDYCQESDHAPLGSES